MSTSSFDSVHEYANTPTIPFTNHRNMQNALKPNKNDTKNTDTELLSPPPPTSYYTTENYVESNDNKNSNQNKNKNKDNNDIKQVTTQHKPTKPPLKPTNHQQNTPQTQQIVSNQINNINNQAVYKQTQKIISNNNIIRSNAPSPPNYNQRPKSSTTYSSYNKQGNKHINSRDNLYTSWWWWIQK